MTTPGFITRVQTRPFDVEFELIPYFTIGCQDTVYLEANLNLPESTGKWGIWFEWEQTGGEPIEWVMGQFDNVAMFAYTSEIRDDKKFRFWVNRGTINEQYADTEVSVVPRGTFSPPVQSVLGNAAYDPLCSVSGLTLATATAEPSWSDYLNNYSQSEVISGYDLTWTPPATTTRLYAYKVEYFDYPTMSWKLYSTAAAGARRANVSNITSSHLRVTPIYKYSPTIFRSLSPSTVDATTLGAAAPEQAVVLSQDSVPAFTGATTTSVVVQKFSLSVLNDTTSQQIVSSCDVGFTGATTTSVVVQKFSLSVLNDTTSQQITSSMDTTLVVNAQSTRVVQSLGIGSLG